jgi:hypothetical protein
MAGKTLDARCYCPDAATIRRECLEIQSRWSDRERIIRAGGKPDEVFCLRPVSPVISAPEPESYFSV